MRKVASAEDERIAASKAPSEVMYGEECSLPNRLGGSEERRELPQRGSGWSPSRRRILAHFEGHKTLLFEPICRCFGRGKSEVNIGDNCNCPRLNVEPRLLKTFLFSVLYSRLSLHQADLLGITTTRCLTVTGCGSICKCTRSSRWAGFSVHYNTVILTYLLINVEFSGSSLVSLRQQRFCQHRNYLA